MPLLPTSARSLGSFSSRVTFSRHCLLLLCATLGTACSTHHWAPIQTTRLAPSPGPKVLHQGRLIVDLERAQETQCVPHAEYSDVCYSNLRAALGQALLDGTWPAFPRVQRGTARDLEKGDYLLQIEIVLDALPPDHSGPGWSTGAKTRFRVLRDGKILSEETLAARSRPEFAYGAPLGAGASEVVKATALHIAERVSLLPETQTKATEALPVVASRELVRPDTTASRSQLAKATPSAHAPSKQVVDGIGPFDDGSTSSDAKSGDSADAGSADAEPTLDGLPVAPSE